MGHHIPVSSLAFLVSSSSHTLITFAHFGLIFDTLSNLKHPCLDLAIESKNMQAMYQNLSLVIVDPKIFYSCRFLLCRTSVMLDQTGVLSMSFRSKAFEIQASEVWRFSNMLYCKMGWRTKAVLQHGCHKCKLKEILQTLSDHCFNILKCIKVKFSDDI